MGRERAIYSRFCLLFVQVQTCPDFANDFYKKRMTDWTNAGLSGPASKSFTIATIVRVDKAGCGHKIGGQQAGPGRAMGLWRGLT